MRRWIVSLVALIAAIGAAAAQSTINPFLPQNGLPYSASIIRGQFDSALSDINALYAVTAGTAVFVKTNTALALYPAALGLAAVRLGVTAEGDAPPQIFLAQAGNCVTNSLVNDIGSCVNGVSGFSWRAVVPSSGLDGRQFGADAAGILDSTGPLQAWGTWALAAQGRTGWLAAGVYKTTSALAWANGNHSSLLGPGGCTARILYSGASTTIDIVSVTHGVEITLDGWCVDSATTMTGGQALHLTDVNYSTIAVDTGQGGKLNNGDPHPTPTLWNGPYFDNTAWNTYRGQSYVRHDALLVAQGVELNVERFINVNKGRAGIHLAGGFGGLYLGYVSVECINVGEYGLLVDNELVATTNLQIFASNRSVFDTCLLHNIKIDNTAADTTLGVRSFSWEGWAGGAGPTAGAAGIYVKNWHNGTVHIGGGATLLSNQGSGVLIDDTISIISIDPAAVINGNAGYGVECSVAMTNIISDAQNQQGTWDNTLGPYAANCGGQLTRATFPSFTPMVSCTGGGGAPTVTAAGTKYRYGHKVYLFYDVTLTSGGTCVTSLNFSVPPEHLLITGCPFHGIENGTKFAMAGYAGTASLVSVFKYDGTIRQTNGDRFFVSGECQAQ